MQLCMTSCFVMASSYLPLLFESSLAAVGPQGAQRGRRAQSAGVRRKSARELEHLGSGAADELRDLGESTKAKAKSLAES